MSREIKAYRDEQKVLVLSLRCNNHCRFCFYSMKERKERDDPDIVQVSRQLAMWREEGTRIVNLHGGEPTVAPTFLKTIALLHRLEMRYTLNSNVRAFSMERFASHVLDTAPPREVLTTLLSSCPEAHDFLTRSEGSHAQTMAGIRRLRKAWIPTSVHIVILEQNYRALPEMVEELISLGCRLKFSFPTFSGEALRNAAEIACRMGDAMPFLRKAVDRLDTTRTDYFVEKAQVCIWPEHFAHVREQVSDIDDRRHYACCEGCFYRDQCAGISDTYARLFGIDEFSAVAAAVPRPSQILLKKD